MLGSYVEVEGCVNEMKLNSSLACLIKEFGMARLSLHICLYNM